MPTLTDIFGKCKIVLYHNESLDLDHYYQEPYQDENDDIEMSDTPYETNVSKKIRHYNLLDWDHSFSNFSFFMDGSRRTYKIGDIVLSGKKIYPVVAAQVRAGCTYRGEDKKLQCHGNILKQNLLLIADKINDVDFMEIKQRILRTELAKSLSLNIVTYHHDPSRDNTPENAAIGKANSIMHGMEIELLGKMVYSGDIDRNKMLIVDGPLQFLKEDTGKPEFADMFYNVAGVSKSFNPLLPTSTKQKRGGTQIGAELIKLNYGDRTPVFMKTNDRRRVFGCWYLRIRPKQYTTTSPLQGIVKIEKMATVDDIERGGLETDIVDNISTSILNEGIPTCYGKDDRWASHLYPVYLTETLIKSSFESDVRFINSFKRDFR